MRIFGLACLLALLLLTPGCGNVFVRGSWNSGTQTVSGFVSVTQLTVVIDLQRVAGPACFRLPSVIMKGLWQNAL